MTTMLKIDRITLTTDGALDSRGAEQLSAQVGDALATEWRASAPRTDLVVERLDIDAPQAELAQRGFARKVARSAIQRILAHRRGE